MTELTLDFLADRSRRIKMAKLTKEKSKEILRHGEVRGHPLTEKQKGFFGARAGGAPKKYRSSSDGAVKT